MNFFKYNTRINIVRTFMISDDDQNRMFVCCGTLKVERLKISKQKEAFLDLFIRKYCSDRHGCDQTDYQSPCVYSVCFPLSVVGSCLICLLPVLPTFYKYFILFFSSWILFVSVVACQLQFQIQLHFIKAKFLHLLLLPILSSVFGSFPPHVYRKHLFYGTFQTKLNRGKSRYSDNG